MGWYDANPVNLNPLMPVETGKKWAAYLGDIDRALEHAREDFENGEYQWVVQLTKELVFADPSNQKARDLCAAALEQLGYQAESGPWRSAYLMGAWELREGNQAHKEGTLKGREVQLSGMSVDMMLSFIDIKTDALSAQHDDFSMKLMVTDTDEVFRLVRRDGILLVYPGETNAETDCVLTCFRLQLFALMSGKTEVIKEMKISGDETVPLRMIKYLTPVARNFNIIEP